MALQATAIEAFKSTSRGQVILPGDDAYDEARAVYNAMIDRRPRNQNIKPAQP